MLVLYLSGHPILQPSLGSCVVPVMEGLGHVYTEFVHQPLDCATGHSNAFAGQLPPHFFCNVDLYIGLPDPFSLRAQHPVTPSPSTAFVRLAQQRRTPPIRRRGNLQDLAERLDPKGSAMLVNEALQDFSRRSSSTWAKNALANFNISLARRNSLDPLGLTGRDSLTHASIDLCALDPFVQGLRHAANLGCDGLDGRPQRRVLSMALLHHPLPAHAPRAKICSTSSKLHPQELKPLQTPGRFSGESHLLLQHLTNYRNSQLPPTSEIALQV